MADQERLQQLRRKAEKMVREKVAGRPQLLQEEDVARLLEELSIHQVELEMQNDELHRSQQALENEKNKYIELYEKAPVPYITISATGNIVHQNEKANQLFNHPNPYFEYISVFPFIAPASKTDFRKLLRNAFMNKTPQSGQVTFVAAGDKKLDAKLHLSVYFDRDADQDLCRLTITDIADEKQTFDRQLRESEEKYRSVVTSMNEGVIMRNHKGGVITWNKAAEHILNLDGDQIESAVNLKPGWHAIREDGSDFPADEHPAMVTLKTGKPQHNVVMGIKDLDGEIRWIIINSQPIFYNSSKSPGAVVTSFSDITHQKKTEKKLRRLNATKDKMFTVIAHDLKSPYNAQLGFLELLMEEGANYSREQRQHFINMVFDSAKKSFALLDNLLLWSRSQTGKVPFNPVDLIVEEVIDENIDLQKVTAEMKEIRIEKNIEHCDIQVSADLEMLNAVLRNLISNAIKFSAPGSKIIIGTRKNNQSEALVYVKDEGRGIPEVVSEKLFSTENNHSTIGTNNEKGTGLGLIISKEFVERNGGRIWVESKEGLGSTFYFTLRSLRKIRRCESNCIQEFDAVLDSIKSNPELLAEFKSKTIPRFLVVYKTFSDSTISEFAIEMRELAEKHGLKQFHNFSKMIITSLEDMDLNQINICFAEFEKLADLIEKEHIPS